MGGDRRHARRGPSDLRRRAHHLTHARQEVRIEAADALACAARHADRPDLIADGLATLGAVVPAAHGRELGRLVLALGSLGADTSPWLSHRDLPVRIAAAWHRLPDAAARRELMDALMDPAAFREADVLSSWDVIATVVALDVTAEELLPVALAQVPHLLPRWAESYGPLLMALRGTPQMQPYLAALVEREDVWDRGNGNASLAFEDAGLPHDRARCAQLAGVDVPRRPSDAPLAAEKPRT